MTQPILSVTLNRCVTDDASISLSITRFCAMKQTLPSPRTASDVKPVVFTALKAYSATPWARGGARGVGRRHSACDAIGAAPKRVEQSCSPAAGSTPARGVQATATAVLAAPRPPTDLVQPPIRREDGDGVVPASLARHGVTSGGSGGLSRQTALMGRRGRGCGGGGRAAMSKRWDERASGRRVRERAAQLCKLVASCANSNRLWRRRRPGKRLWGAQELRPVRGDRVGCRHGCSRDWGTAP